MTVNPAVNVAIMAQLHRIMHANRSRLRRQRAGEADKATASPATCMPARAVDASWTRRILQRGRMKAALRSRRRPGCGDFDTIGGFIWRHYAGTRQPHRQWLRFVKRRHTVRAVVQRPTAGGTIGNSSPGELRRDGDHNGRIPKIRCAPQQSVQSPAYRTPDSFTITHPSNVDNSTETG